MGETKVGLSDTEREAKLEQRIKELEAERCELLEDVKKYRTKAEYNELRVKDTNNMMREYRLFKGAIDEFKCFIKYY